MDVNEIWQKARPIIENNVSSISYDLYIKPLEPQSFENGVYTLLAFTTRDAGYARNERHFPHIEAAIKTVAPLVEKVEIIDALEKERRDAKLRAEETGEPEPQRIVRHNIVNPQQTFDNFIVGRSNQEVAAMAEFVAKHPGKKINPLFIYGRPGLGKTHLLNAIANYILGDDPGANLVLTSCQKFTSDYVDVIKRKGDFGAFREKYRNVDILLIDDIQELTDKEATQEEFFHTFNDLFDHNRQIVITSDRHPKEIATLKDRLISRFNGGILQDIRTPDVEMRTAILKKKAELEGHFLPDDIATYIAEYSFKMNEDIRYMEGHLFKIIFYAELNGRIIPTIEDCDLALAEKDEDDNNSAATAATIIATVANYFNVTPDDIIGKRRTSELVNVRMIATYILTQKLKDLPLTEIGEILGGRTHVSVIYSRDRIENLMTKDEKLKSAVEDIMKQIKK